MFSVIIPLYNKEQSIAKTIAHVLKQRFVDLEILVINDGSTDGSLAAVAAIDDPRIRVINKANGGVSSARNLGIQEAKHPWIALLDGDDIWEEQHLSNMFAVMEQQEVQCICTGFVLAQSNGTVIKTYQVEKEGLHNYFRLSNQMGFPVHSSAIAMRKTILGDLRFNEKLTIGEDNDFWEKLGRKTEIYFIREVSSRYIDDSENKAIRKKHDLSKTHIYNIDLNIAMPEQEFVYYKKLIIYNVLLSFKNYNFANGLKLYWKHKKQVKGIDFFRFIVEIIRK
ncbi:glycosyltransferase family 2 protein [Flavobacterium sp. JP2137]|uniref:glycosyltransferase family 2 protein n=1 Tax=Flavobacterium sp. JP2137 TaxID=3414510 RepID=UPI003D30054D